MGENGKNRAAGGRAAQTDLRGKVTVVIPNYNGIRYIADCLDALLAGTALPRLIVVDNGSADGSFELVRDRYPQVTLLRLRANTGFCHAVNSGLRIARTRYVILLNNDTRADMGFVQALYEAIAQCGRAFSASAKMLSMKDPEVIDDAGDLYCALGWAFARGKAQSRDRYTRGDAVFSACGGAAIYRREVFEKIGYFDERHFCYLEDVDIGWRAMLHGYRNIYAPQAIVYHAGSASSGAVHNPFKELMTAGNNAYLLYKNMPPFQYALNRPLIALGVHIKRAYFARKGLGASYEAGLARGEALIARARAEEAERRAGRMPARGSIWEEAGLGEQTAGGAAQAPTGAGAASGVSGDAGRAAGIGGTAQAPTGAGAASGVSGGAGRAAGIGGARQTAGPREPQDGAPVHPLYLGGRVPFSLLRLPYYLKIQGMLWANCIRRLRG